MEPPGQDAKAEDPPRPRLTVSAPTSEIPSVAVPAEGDAEDKGDPRYSQETLMALKDAPLSRQWPTFLEEDFKNSRGLWDPDHWHQNRRKNGVPADADLPPSATRGEGKPPIGGIDKVANGTRDAASA